MSDGCKWPNSVCACYTANAEKYDPYGRIWMHCDEGLSLSKASMSRFVMFCLMNHVEIGEIHPLNYRFKNSQVLASVRIRPEQVSAFNAETGGKLRRPPKVSLNSSTSRSME